MQTTLNALNQINQRRDKPLQITSPLPIFCDLGSIPRWSPAIKVLSQPKTFQNLLQTIFLCEIWICKQNLLTPQPASFIESPYPNSSCSGWYLLALYCHSSSFSFRCGEQQHWPLLNMGITTAWAGVLHWGTCKPTATLKPFEAAVLYHGTEDSTSLETLRLWAPRTAR